MYITLYELPVLKNVKRHYFTKNHLQALLKTKYVIYYKFYINHSLNNGVKLEYYRAINDNSVASIYRI